MKKKRIYFSIILAIASLIVAIYLYVQTPNYINSTIWILVCPLVLSGNPVFYQSPEKLTMKPENHRRLKKTLNIIRFALFAFGAGLFLLQVFTDFSS